MRLPKFRCKNKIGNWCFFTVLHNGNANEENFDLETLSQFTGLLDKQGIEIYEGDIVKVSSYLVNGLGEVGFNGGSFVFNKFKYQTSQVLHSFSEIEVIGNIYEHHHLLEANHEI